MALLFCIFILAIILLAFLLLEIVIPLLQKKPVLPSFRKKSNDLAVLEKTLEELSSEEKKADVLLDIQNKRDRINSKLNNLK